MTKFYRKVLRRGLVVNAQGQLVYGWVPMPKPTLVDGDLVDADGFIVRARWQDVPEPPAPVIPVAPFVQFVA